MISTLAYLADIKADIKQSSVYPSAACDRLNSTEQ